MPKAVGLAGIQGSSNDQAAERARPPLPTRLSDEASAKAVSDPRDLVVLPRETTRGGSRALSRSERRTRWRRLGSRTMNPRPATSCRDNEPGRSLPLSGHRGVTDAYLALRPTLWTHPKQGATLPHRWPHTTSKVHVRVHVECFDRTTTRSDMQNWQSGDDAFPAHAPSGHSGNPAKRSQRMNIIIVVLL